MIKVWVNQNNQVIEIAAMTGTYCFFKKRIPVLGIEPAANG